MHKELYQFFTSIVLSYTIQGRQSGLKNSSAQLSTHNGTYVAETSGKHFNFEFFASIMESMI